MALIQFSGLASGINSAALIDAIVEARETSNIHRRAELELLENTNDSLEELNTKILALNDLVDQFRTINGGGVKKKGTSSDPTVATAVAGSNAVNASYDITVNTVADAGTGSIQSTGTYASISDVFSASSGTLTITAGLAGEAIDITASITGGSTTIAQVVDSLNSDTDASGRFVASLINVGSTASPDYQIVLNTLELGTDKGNIVIDNASFADTTTALDQATDANFSLSGISGTITRSTNSVSDVISGVTLNLLSAGSSTISVANDEDSTADLVGEIVDAYNDIATFVNENDTITRVEENTSTDNVFGSLAKTNVDNDLITQFRSSLVSASSTNGTIVTSMSELGISTNRDGTLSFDVEEFKEKVSQDSTGAAEVLTDFADNVAGISGVLSQYTNFNGFIDLAQQSNDAQIENLNQTISQLERRTTKLRENLEGQFMRLESVTSKLQNTQQALSGILAGLG